MNLPATVDRVPIHTKEDTNLKFEQRLEMRIRYYSAHPEEIDERLAQLDREWDIERTLETNASTLSLTGLLLGAVVNKKFFILPIVVQGFLLQHALQGWCPPLPVLRRMGKRTQTEIEAERYALKALRGDFNKMHESSGVATGRADAAYTAIKHH